jgi:caffeoyl-CoA O-methyltransferase
VTPATDRALERYAEAHTTPLSPDLAALARETELTFDWPQMMSGPVVGRLLGTLVRSLRAELVLEIGTFTGFSAVAMASSLAPGGRLISCEVNVEHAEFARRRIHQAGLDARAEVRLGDALETIAEIDGPIDLVFIDADKQRYIDYYEAVLPKLAEHGLIVADNTLMGSRAMAAFNERVSRDERVVASLLTVRDGVTVIGRAG